MTKLTTILAAGAATVILPSLGLAGPAAAQDSGVAEIIVYGTDPCPRSTDDQVVVCARKPESERYRIPERLRSSGPRQVRDSWVNKAKQLETVGATGTNSCSPVGPGGFTGCLTQVIKQARDERNEQSDSDYVPQN